MIGNTIVNANCVYGAFIPLEGKVFNWFYYRILAVAQENIGGGNRQRDGKQSGREKTPYGGMVDGGNINQRRERSGNCGRERNITRFSVPVPSRSRPDYIFPSSPLPRVPLVYTGIYIPVSSPRSRHKKPIYIVSM